jgi:hypothetical protein
MYPPFQMNVPLPGNQIDPSVFGFLVVFGIVYFIFWLFALSSLLARTDLDPVEKLTWVIVMIFVAFFGLIFYLAIAPARNLRSNRKIHRSNQLAGTPWENDPGHTGRG